MGPGNDRLHKLEDGRRQVERDERVGDLAEAFPRDQREELVCDRRGVLWASETRKIRRRTALSWLRASAAWQAGVRTTTASCRLPISSLRRVRAGRRLLPRRLRAVCVRQSTRTRSHALLPCAWAELQIETALIGVLGLLFVVQTGAEIAEDAPFGAGLLVRHMLSFEVCDLGSPDGID